MKRTDHFCLAPLHEAADAVAEAGPSEQERSAGAQPGREEPNWKQPVGKRSERMAADREQGAEARHEVSREEQRIEAQACEQEKTVTQLSPDEVLADGGSMRSTSGGEAPTEREMEQDVMTTNPSIESMESRG